MINKLFRLATVLFSKPYDTSTKIGQERERVRRIAQSSATGMIAKVINILSGIITVPLTLPYLGTEQFGIWMVLTGFVAFLVFSDFGLSIGLKAKLAQCFGENNTQTAVKYISTAFILLSSIAVLIAILAVTVVANMDIHTFIILTNPDNLQALKSTSVMLLLVFSIGMPSAVIHRTLESYQLGAVANTAIAIGRLMSLCSIFICVYLGFSLPVMASLYLGLPLLAMYLCGIWFFNKEKNLRPKIKLYDKKYAYEIISIGKLALSAQLGASLMASGPLIVLTSIFGAAAITPYAITKRMFDAITMVLSELLYPLWPAYGEALVKKDYPWIIRTFKKSALIALFAFLPICILLSSVGQDLIYLWSNDESAVPSWSLLMMCNFWTFLLLVVRVFSMLLNGVNQFKGQAFYGLILPTLALVSGWFFAHSVSLVLSLFIMIFIGEIIRILFMTIETHRLFKYFSLLQSNSAHNINKVQ